MKAVSLYGEYKGFVPHAQKWGEEAQGNVDYWESQNPT